MEPSSKPPSPVLFWFLPGASGLGIVILLFSGVHDASSTVFFIAMLALAVLPPIAVGIDAKRSGLCAVSITGVVLKSIVVTLGTCVLAFIAAFFIAVGSGQVTFG